MWYCIGCWIDVIVNYFDRLIWYKGFKEGYKCIFVVIDFVGCGIDIECVNIVINYDMLDFVDIYLYWVSCFWVFFCFCSICFKCVLFWNFDGNLLSRILFFVFCFYLSVVFYESIDLSSCFFFVNLFILLFRLVE